MASAYKPSVSSTDSVLPSTSTGTLNSIICHLCGKYFFSHRGLNIHLARTHRTTEDSINDISINNSDNLNSQVLTPCPYCGKLYKSVNIHISRVHGSEFREKLANDISPHLVNPIDDYSYKSIYHAIISLSLPEYK